MPAAASSGRIAVAAIVVNWRQPDLTSAAVASLEAQTGLGDVDLSVVIVDNGSGDGSAEVLAARHPQHALVAVATNGGFGAGVNAGIRAVAAEVYVLLNNDAVASAGFVAVLVGALRAEPSVGAVTGRIVLRERYREAAIPVGAESGSGAGPRDAGAALVAADGARWVVDAEGQELVNSTGNEVTRSGNGRDRDWLVPVDRDRRPAGEVMGFSGGAAALRASALAQVGLFDESLFMYYEDTDLSWRLRRAGWGIRYEPSASVRHAHAASTGTGSHTFRFYNERNRVLVAAKNAPAAVLLTALARTIVGTARTLATAFVASARAGDAPDAGDTLADAQRRVRSLSAALGRLPAALGERRRLDRAAVVPRAAVAAFLVRD
ncbi:glycosyltransferase family 2 protein [Herbiconiux daphne]|uniref:Glycosyltransferase family 2 protein n=1 Tax=Herbiconiux daphne TaxID=2970914 RepID=A0ABT2H4M8_9MICO|nr:glycosyltransferase family 2 protein [Herbiconiux daphne]MCS5734886.1 glycosyltransferase family 2 protein [Herbiconiux daphne]